MRYGIFSDVHANLSALREVIGRLGDQRIDALLCLGDLVGYGAQPNECVEYIAGLPETAGRGVFESSSVVAGNHDWACAGRVGLEGFQSDAAKSVVWTRDMLSGESKNYLATLPLVWRGHGITAVHASPVNPAMWTYVTGVARAREVLVGMQNQICFIGHTHYPAVFRLCGDECEMREGGSFTLEENCKYLVNVGSAGYLRRKAGAASYAVYDERERKVDMFQFDAA